VNVLGSLTESVARLIDLSHAVNRIARPGTGRWDGIAATVLIALYVVAL
jgi:hypothetical protein